jgi:hypothetical protein
MQYLYKIKLLFGQMYIIQERRNCHMFLKWLNVEGELHIHDSFLEKLPESVCVQYGNLKEEMVVKGDNSVGVECIGLPESFRQHYTIPENIPYEIKIDGGTVKIGPIIAFIPTTKLNQLTIRSMKFHEKRLRNYREIKGLFVITAANGINIQNKSILGYYYKPGGKDIRSRWVKGIFPYPDALYKRRRLNKIVKQSLFKEIGEDHVINSNLFNKKELWDSISSKDEIRQYFPYTEGFKDFQQIKNLLKTYPVLYLKPADGSKGIGIIKIERFKGKNTVLITNRNMLKKFFYNLDFAERYFKKIIRKPYLIQQGIQSEMEGHKVDFRAYLQKNYTGNWNLQGIIARAAKKDSIVTNLKYIEKIFIGDDALKQTLKVDQAALKDISERIRRTCILICEEIDKKLGNYGDVAIDFIIDDDLNIWILEINKAYTIRSLKLLKQYRLYSKLLTTPIEYAKYLAGF